MQRLTVIALVAVAAGLGCGVRTTVHQKALLDLQACQGELGTTRAKRDRAVRRAKQLESELSQHGESASLSAAHIDATNQITKLERKLEPTEAELRELRRQRVARDKRLALHRELQKRLGKAAAPGKISARLACDRLVVEIAGHVLFASDETTLSKSGAAALMKVLGELGPLSRRRFMVVGHTDYVRTRDRRIERSWHLSAARAATVASFIVATGGRPERITAVGRGRFTPASAPAATGGVTADSRIEIVLVPERSQLGTCNDAEG